MIIFWLTSTLTIAHTNPFSAACTSASSATSDSAIRIFLVNATTAPTKDILEQTVSISNRRKLKCLNSNIQSFAVSKVRAPGSWLACLSDGNILTTSSIRTILLCSEWWERLWQQFPSSVPTAVSSAGTWQICFISFFHYRNVVGTSSWPW